MPFKLYDNFLPGGLPAACQAMEHSLSGRFRPNLPLHMRAAASKQSPLPTSYEYFLYQYGRGRPHLKPPKFRIRLD